VLQNLLGKVVERVRHLDPANSRRWFDDLRLVYLSGGALGIGCSDPDQVQYLKDYCKDAFTRAAQQVTGHLVVVEFQVIDDATQVAQPVSSGPRLHPDYTFDSFVVGPSNRLAHAGSVAVSRSLGTVYNPLFLYGQSGLGKTHLLHAIAHQVRQENDRAVIELLTCEEFVHQFIQAIQQGDMMSFQCRIRAADLLVIDDVQFLCDSEQSQEEFFHTFNALYNSGNQIVLSADKPPAEIPGVEARLISRFNWGLVARIDPPTFETRVAILQRKAQLRGFQISDDVAEYLAKHIQANIRELEGALTTIYALAMTEQGPLTVDLARRALECQLRLAVRTVAISDIIEVVAAHFNLRPGDLNGKRRNKSVTLPRQICMYLARELTNHSFEEIGAHLGGRDHTTVMHACQKVGQACGSDQSFKALVDDLKRKITRACQG
jgi:chromosomal replication initiator protein